MGRVTRTVPKVGRPEFLTDELPWNQKKAKNTILASLYDDVDADKAIRLRDCGTFIGLRGEEIAEAFFCQIRLCPLCAWRRGLKIFAHTMKIMEAIKESTTPMAYIFVTLTVRNVVPARLSGALDAMYKGWNRLIGYKAIKGAVRGFYRGMEVTHNIDPRSHDYDTYHPHFHCVFAVPSRYFKGTAYLQQAEWADLWRRAMRLDYDPVVDVRKVKGDTAKAVSEIAKYAVKDADYIIPGDLDLSTEAVRVLDNALHRRRLVAYGGIMKEWHKRLNLDDTEDGDLVDIDGEAKESDEPITYYSWNTGYGRYTRYRGGG